MKNYIQTIGTILVAIGLIIALYSNAYNGAVDYSSKYERNTWFGDASMYIAITIVFIGIVLALIGAANQRKKDNA